ncbi:MAG: ABC transporter permease, partial [Gammaproteobacteria bacterium]|nr:ABC transporter permease [Gammaproteobacteria bacterium]
MTETTSGFLYSTIQKLGRSTVKVIEEAGYTIVLLSESLFWIFFGHFYKQPVRLPSVFSQMISVGIAAPPIVFILSFAIGVMLAIQIIYNLR